MFGFGKKAMPSSDVAELIVCWVADSNDKFASQADRLISAYPQYAPLRSQLIEESQWVAIAAGLIVVRLQAESRLYKSLLDEILAFYRGCSIRGSTQRAFTDAEIEEIGKRLSAYSVRFNRRLSIDKSATLETAVEDVANEAAGYITGRSRRTDVEYETIMKLQERTLEKDELEGWVASLFHAGLDFFLQHLHEQKVF